MVFRLYSHTQRADNINVLKYSDFQVEIDVNIRGGFDPLAPVVPNISLDLTQYKPFTHMLYSYNGIAWVANIDTVYQSASSLYTISGTVNPAATCIYSNTLSNSLLYIEYGDYERSIKSMLPPTAIVKGTSTLITKELDHSIFPTSIWFAVHMASVKSDFNATSTGATDYSRVKALGASGDVYVMNAWTLQSLQLAFFLMDVEDIKKYAESIDYIEVIRGVGGSDVGEYCQSVDRVHLQATYDVGGVYQTMVGLTDRYIDLSGLQSRALYQVVRSPGTTIYGPGTRSFDDSWHIYTFDFTDNPIGIKDYNSNISIDYGGVLKLNFTVADSGSTKLSNGGTFTDIGFGYRFDWVTSTFYGVPIVDGEPIYSKMVSSTSTERLPWLSFGNLTISKLNNQSQVMAAQMSYGAQMAGAGMSALTGNIVGGLTSAVTGTISALGQADAIKNSMQASYLNSAALNNNVSSVGGSPNMVLDDTIRCTMYQTNVDINQSAAQLVTGYPSNQIYRGIDNLTESVYKCRTFVYKPITDSKYTYPAEFVTALTNQLTTSFFYIP